MRGVLLVPSSSPTLSPIYDGLDVSVTSNITSFHLDYDMVSRRIYKLSFYGALHGGVLFVYSPDPSTDSFEKKKKKKAQPETNAPPLMV